MAKEEKKGEFTSVSIPTSLFNKIKERIKGTGFDSVSSYVTYVLREVISSEEEEKEKPYTKEEEEKVKERLRALGYLG
jgi:Arc/MetJ-type ribon-helix-helix transcriptional regulator